LSLRIVIVEDEVMVARRTIMFCKKILAERLESVEHFSVIEDAEDYLSSHDIDLLLLDLNLNNKDGFELLKNKLALGFNTIVISANTDRAIEAFEYGVIDFIGKPFKEERLKTAFERIDGKENSYKRRKYLPIKKYGSIEMCNIEEIISIKAEGHYSELKMQDGSTELYDKNLERLLKLLPEEFIRVHKSYAVAIGKVKTLHRYEGSRYELELSNGDKVPLGRTRYVDIKDKLEKY